MSWYFIGPFVYLHTLCVHSEGSGETARMPEPSLVAYVISTIISWPGSFSKNKTSNEIYNPNKWVVLEGDVNFNQRSLSFWESFECEWDIWIPNRMLTHSLTWVSEGIISLSLSGVYLEWRKRIQPIACQWLKWRMRVLLAWKLLLVCLLCHKLKLTKSFEHAWCAITCNVPA